MSNKNVKGITIFILIGFFVIVILTMFPDLSINEIVEINHKERPLIFSNSIIVNSKGVIYVSNDLFGAVQVYDSSGKYKYTISVRTTSMLDMYMDEYDNLHIDTGRSGNIYVVDTEGQLKEIYTNRDYDKVALLKPEKRRNYESDKSTWSMKKYLGLYIIEKNSESTNSIFAISKLWHLPFHLLIRYYFVVLFFILLREKYNARHGEKLTNEEIVIGIKSQKISFIKFVSAIWRHRTSTDRAKAFNFFGYNERNYNRSELDQIIFCSVFLIYVFLKMWTATSIYIADELFIIGKMLALFFSLSTYIVLDLTCILIRYEFSSFEKIYSANTGV